MYRLWHSDSIESMLIHAHVHVYMYIHVCACVSSMSNSNDINNFFFYCRILTSQFPPALTEKIALVGGGAIPLDQHSILEGKHMS